MRFPVLLTPLLTGAAFCVLSLSLTARAADLDWRAVIAALDSTSPVLAESRLQLAEARMEYASARAIPNPVAAVELQNLKDDSESEKEQTIGIHQPLGFLWSKSSDIAARKYHFQSKQAAFEEAHQALIAELMLSVAKLYNLNEQRTLLDSVLVAASQAKLAMDARLREGDVSEYEAQRMEAEMVEVEFRKLEIENELRSLAHDLVNLTGLPIEMLRELPMPELPVPPFADVASALEYGRNNRHTLAEKILQSKAAEKSLLSAKRQQLPDFGVGVARKTADPNWSGLVLEAELEIPIWSRRTAERRFASANLAITRKTQIAAELSVTREITAAMERWARMQKSSMTPRVYRFEDALTGLNRGVKLYATGEFGALELVDALRTSVDALAAYQELDTEMLTANLELRRATGLTILE